RRRFPPGRLGRLLLTVLRLLLLLLLLRSAGLLGLALLALAPLAAAGPAGGQLRLGQVLRQRAGDFLHRAEPLPRRLEQLGRARRIALRGGEQRGSDWQGQLERRVHELGSVFLVPVST